MASFTPYNIISVCSGTGGLDLAVGLAVKNAVTVCHVEREAQAAEILAARMEDQTIHAAPIWSDLSTFDGKPWRGVVDCIISGDPCQPNSVAGKRSGADDDRFLIDQLIRVIDEVRPSRLFRENVTGNADGQLLALVPKLEKMGYAVAAGIFSASEVGAPHQRERLFIMANTSTGRRAGQIEGKNKLSRGAKTFSSKHELGNSKSQRLLSPCGARGGRGRSANSGPQMADAMRPELEGKRRKLHSKKRRQGQDGSASLYGRAGIFAPGPSDSRWAGIIREFPELAPAITKEAECKFRGISNGLANRTDRLRAGGNGVCSMAGALAWLSLSAHFEPK